MKERTPWFHTRPMAGAALGAILAAILGSLAPDWVLLVLCALLIPVSAFLFQRRSAFFLLPIAAFFVLVRIVLLPQTLPADSGISVFLVNLRESLSQNADALFRDEAAAARGMLLGDTSLMDSATHTQYARSGLLHLFAVSGLHVTILVGMLGKLIRTENKALSFSVLTLFLLFLCGVTSFSPSVLRASFVLIGLRLCEVRERKADMPTVFCFAFALTLLCEPFAYAKVGFQLSFAAMGGMVLFSRMFRKLLPKQLRSALIARTVFSALTAVTGMLPLSAYYFNEFTWISIPLSILLIPVMPVVLLCGFLSVLLYGLFPHFAALLSLPAYGGIKLLSITTQTLNVPALRVPAPHPVVIALYWIALLLCSPLFLPNRKHPRWIGLGMLAVTVVLWFVL